MVKDGAVLLDVRTPEEWGQEHIPGAVNIPVDDIDGRASELSKDKPVVTYCKSGMRAHRAAEALRAKGFTVYELGGIGDWDTTDC
ncbi:MAG: rhodanese-like domain-containing protein [Myxococcales bacterium]|nr:rhodanese-like domain-containing protein [Myxococcales bacterium]MCB9579608.1 rhodanese-like domain-containing protein [Polyangiaceae bacterium]